jgi:hypothetical protein
VCVNALEEVAVLVRAGEFGAVEAEVVVSRDFGIFLDGSWSGLAESAKYCGCASLVLLLSPSVPQLRNNVPCSVLEY